MDSFSPHDELSGMPFHLLPTCANCEVKHLWLRIASGRGLLLDGVFQSSQPSLLVGSLPTSPGLHSGQHRDLGTCSYGNLWFLWSTDSQLSSSRGKRTAAKKINQFQEHSKLFITQSKMPQSGQSSSHTYNVRPVQGWITKSLLFHSKYISRLVTK